MNEIQQGITALLKSAVTGESLPLPSEFSLDEAAPVLLKQGLISLAYQGALNCGISRDTPVMQKMLAHYYRHMLRSERQMRALQRIFDAFEANGIDYLPVKGCNLKNLYPKPELRSMGDADILIRTEQLDQCGPILTGLGFRLKLESDHTDNWQSEDLYVELHKSLVPPEDEDYYAYYGSGWARAVRGQGSRYDLSPEDTFVFLFTHFARHYRISGIGCRHVLDLYVYRRGNPELKEEDIRGELRKLDLLEFYENTLSLLEVWFEGRSPDAVTELMTTFIFSGGSWGTMEAELYAREMREARGRGQVKGSGWRAALRALFPPLSTIRNRYQILLRFPALLPVMWVVRWFDVLLFSRDKMRRKLKILRQLDDQQVLSHQQALSAVGLRQM